MADPETITIVQGQTWSVDITYLADDDTPVDLTG
jgi:hypothetical protein